MKNITQKSQLSTFITIFCIIILFSILIINNKYSDSNIINYKDNKIFTNEKIEECFMYHSKKTLDQLTQQGGIYFFQNNTIITENNIFPIYYNNAYNNFKNISKNSIENEISFAISNNILDCIKSTDNIQTRPLTETFILPNELYIKIDFPVILDNNTKQYKKFSFRLNSNLNNFITTTEKIINISKNSNNIEITKLNKIAQEDNTTINYMLSLYENIPIVIYTLQKFDKYSNENFSFISMLNPANQTENFAIDVNKNITLKSNAIHFEPIICNTDCSNVSYNIKSTLNNINITSDGIIIIDTKNDQIGNHIIFITATNNKNITQSIIANVKVEK